MKERLKVFLLHSGGRTYFFPRRLEFAALADTTVNFDLGLRRTTKQTDSFLTHLFLQRTHGWCRGPIGIRNKEPKVPVPIHVWQSLPDDLYRLVEALDGRIRENVNFGLGFPSLGENSLYQRLEDVAVEGRVFGNNEDLETHKAASNQPSANSSPIGCLCTISVK